LDGHTPTSENVAKVFIDVDEVVAAAAAAFCGFCIL